MKAPDKIYANDYGLWYKVRPAVIATDEYIRKESLLEWANEQIKVAKVNNLAHSPFEKLIDKLESM